jgi:hypothetical protein
MCLSVTGDQRACCETVQAEPHCSTVSTHQALCQTIHFELVARVSLRGRGPRRVISKRIWSQSGPSFPVCHITRNAIGIWRCQGNETPISHEIVLALFYLLRLQVHPASDQRRGDATRITSQGARLDDLYNSVAFQDRTLVY